MDYSYTPQKAKRTIGRNDINPMQVALTMKTLYTCSSAGLVSALAKSDPKEAAALQAKAKEEKE